jgi:hypothetical protein
MQVLAFDDDRAFRAASGVPRWRARVRRDRRIATFAALSLLLHALVLWQVVPPLADFALGETEIAPGAPIVARMQEAPAAAVPESSAPPPRASAPAAVPAPAPAPPVVARAAPRLSPPVLTAPLPSVPAPLTVPELPPPLQPLEREPRTAPLAKQYQDLSAYVAAQRQARGEPAEGLTAPTPARGDDERARRERALARNLASLNATPGEAKNSGGIFQITRLGYNDAEFTFFGWHREIRRRATQRVEVRRGAEPDIRIAVVRRMIAIIREYEQEDFTWSSNRLGREVTLSARAADTAGLEEFLLREFFW